MAGYYDIVLVLIPLTLAGLTGVLVASGFSLTTAIPIGSVVSASLIGHAMFVRTPVETNPAVGSGETAGFSLSD